MHSGRHYTIQEFLYWTRRKIYLLVILAIIPTVLYTTTGLTWIGLPWPPILLVGTAAGTKNPFEGAANDVPICTISHTIEIDLKEMLGVENIPAARTPINFIQM